MRTVLHFNYFLHMLFHFSIVLQFCPHSLNDVVAEIEPFQRACSIYEIRFAMMTIHKMI